MNKRGPSIDDLIARLPPNDRTRAAHHILRIEGYRERQSQRDAEIVQAIIRVVKHPAHQRLADELRALIMRGTN